MLSSTGERTSGAGTRGVVAHVEDRVHPVPARAEARLRGGGVLGPDGLLGQVELRAGQVEVEPDVLVQAWSVGLQETVMATSVRSASSLRPVAVRHAGDKATSWRVHRPSST